MLTIDSLEGCDFPFDYDLCLVKKMNCNVITIFA